MPPLSEVNPSVLSPARTLAYAYVFMADYLEDSMIKPPTEAQAVEAAAAVGLANAATYAVATSPAIRPMKSEKAEGAPASRTDPLASLNICPIPPSMLVLTDDEEEVEEGGRSAASFHADRKLVISKTSPELIGSAPSDALSTIIAASKSPMLQAVSDAMRNAAMPTVKLEGAANATSASSASDATSSSPAAPLAPSTAAAQASLSANPTVTAQPAIAPSTLPSSTISLQQEVTLMETDPPAASASIKTEKPSATVSTLLRTILTTPSTSTTPPPPARAISDASGDAVMEDARTRVEVLTPTSAALAQATEVAIARAATAVSTASSVTDESPLLTSFSPQTKAAIVAAHRQLAAAAEAVDQDENEFAEAHADQPPLAQPTQLSV